MRRKRKMMAAAIRIKMTAIASFAVKGMEVLDLVLDCDLSYEDCIALARLSASLWYTEDFSSTVWERRNP